MEENDNLVQVKTFISENTKTNLYKIGQKKGLANLTDLLRMAIIDFVNKNATLLA